MTIKEVENLTGLTAKSIRYYETQGLISVNRKDGNNYRDYTEENIEQLKKIKLFRYLEFSVEEIKEIFKAYPERKIELFDAKRKELSELADKSETKRTHLQTLITNTKYGKEDIESIIENIEFWESVETEEFRAAVKDISIPTLNSCIYQTIVFGSPIISLFIKIANGITDILMFNSIFAIISTVILTLVWSNYFHTRKYAKEEMKKKNKSQNFMWLFLPLGIIFCILVIIGSNLLMVDLFAPENWLFFEQSNVYIIILLITSVALLFSIAYLIKEFFKKENRRIKNRLITFCVAFLFCILGGYFAFVNNTYVTENSIVVCTAFNPMGTAYDIEDIEKIETGFGSERFTFFEYKKRGAFYYKIHLDGKEIIFHQPSANDIERYNDTYLELEEFDEKLMNLGIEKTSSNEFSEYCDYDQKYVDRFLRIINNK